MRPVAFAMTLLFATTLAWLTDAAAKRERFTGDNGAACVSESFFGAEGEVMDMFCCEPGEVMLADESCMNSLMVDFFSSFWGFVIPGGGFSGGGGGGIPPKPPDRPPTKEECEAAGASCQKNTGGTQRSCEASKMQGMLTRINTPSNVPPGTCYGNTADIVGTLDSFLLGQCTEADLTFEGSCRHKFMVLAATQCINGIHGSSTAETTTFHRI